VRSGLCAGNARIAEHALGLEFRCGLSNAGCVRNMAIITVRFHFAQRPLGSRTIPNADAIQFHAHGSPTWSSTNRDKYHQQVTIRHFLLAQSLLRATGYRRYECCPALPRPQRDYFPAPPL